MSASQSHRIGPYRIVRVIGEGGMGVVYEAVHTDIERRVAIKVLLPEHAGDVEQVTRFWNEARAVNRIEHPSIVQVSEFGHTAEGMPYMVMEFLRGESLSQRLDRLHSTNKRLNVVQSLQIAAQVADALTAAHEKSIVHRDLKPGNVMLVRDPVAAGGERAKVLDFGIAKLQKGPKVGRTGIHEVLGTPMYMSPEQCRGAGGVDEKTDVYALGVILYEMLAGEPPFAGVAGVSLMAKHVTQPPPPVRQRAPQASAEVEALVDRLLQKDKDKRPSMKDASDELGVLLARTSGMNSVPMLPSGATPRPESERAMRTTLGHSLGQTLRRKQGSRKLFVIGAVALLAVTVVIGRTASSWLRGGPPAVVTQPLPGETKAAATKNVEDEATNIDPAPPTKPHPAKHKEQPQAKPSRPPTKQPIKQPSKSPPPRDLGKKGKAPPVTSPKTRVQYED